MASIELKKIIKKYSNKKGNEHQVLHGIDACIGDGEFVVIVGPSGCGKSTLLRIIAGLEKISSGQVFIGERDVTFIEPSKRKIAMVFQNYALYPHMTVFNNMAYGIRLAKVSSDQIDKRINRVAKMLELEQLLNKKPKELSGGQRQRVAMGRAIVREPSLFLFDEPLSNLDAKLRTQTRLEIRKQHQDLGITSLYVTHDQIEAMTLADRIMVMNAGHIEQFATPDEIYANPASTFVASFMGSPPMNLLHVQKNENRIMLGKHTINLSDATKTILNRNHANVILGIRPEHLTYLNAPTEDAWSVELVMTETLGAEILFHLRIGQQIMVMRLSVEQASFIPKNKGHRFWVRPKSAYIKWFDAGSGKSIVCNSKIFFQLKEAA